MFRFLTRQQGPEFAGNKGECLGNVQQQKKAFSFRRPSARPGTRPMPVRQRRSAPDSRVDGGSMAPADSRRTSDTASTISPAALPASLDNNDPHRLLLVCGQGRQAKANAQVQHRQDATAQVHHAL